MELKKIVQTANKNVIYLKNGFEKVYHENVNCYDRADRYKINQTFALLTCMLGGSLFENFIGLMWKPYAAWSYVEFAGIVYFLYRGGSYGGDLVFDYLDNISTSRPIPTAYASELVEGGSYENPIDLTSSNDEEEDAEEDADEDEEEEEDEDEEEEDEERYQHALKKHNEQRGMANDLRHQLTVAHKIIESQKDDIKKAVENASHATDIVMEKEKIINRFQETISDKCKTIDSLYAELGKYQSSRKNRHNQQEVCSANPIHIMKSGKTRILVPSFMEEDEGY